MPTGPADPTRRELRRRALWLAELATARPGFIGQYVKQFGALPGSLRVTPQVVAAAFRGRRGEADESLFGAVLGAGPPASPALVVRPPHPAPVQTAVVTCMDDAYPQRLFQLNDPPPALFLAGRIEEALAALSARPSVAVVGSRRPSPYGREMAQSLGRDLARAGAVVLSGMALGVDAEAQYAALAQDADIATVGVLGCGTDLEHPPGNRKLFARVRRHGLLVSEFLWGTSPLPWRFPCRNRVLAALAAAVVVVEGGERSGAGITARHGLELGREVLAVPGEAGRRLSACPHQLLRNGAAICESAKDVLDALHLEARPTPATTSSGPGPATASGQLAPALLAALDACKSSADQLATHLRLPVGAVLAALTDLELAGEVAVEGDRYRRRRGRPEG